MRSILILVLLCFFAFPAAAQTRTVPASRGEVTLSFAPLVKQAAPAVVNVYTKKTVTRRVSPFMGDPFFDQFFGNSLGFGGLTRKRVESALGSGVIVDPDGLIVTNAHVVKDAEEITIVLTDGREFEARKVLADPPSDLALLRVDAGREKLPYINLKPSESLEVGDLVLAIGNPFGVGQTVTSGIVSAVARSSLDINDFNFFIQTDAAINPGNSGGALVSMDGGLVGINTAIYSRDGGSLGIGFAIPSEMVASVMAAERAGDTGKNGVTRAWLGISAQKVTAEIADSLGFRVPHGVLVADMHKASPALKAGLKIGDVVTAVNGREVREPADMKFRMATVPLGSKAAFDVIRKGRKTKVSVAAIAPPDDPPREETILEGRSPLSGAKVANINPAVAVEAGLGEESGVAVLGVVRGSSASRVVSAGDVIVQVNGTPVETVKDLKSALRAGAGRGWDIVISQGGRKRQIMLR